MSMRVLVVDDEPAARSRLGMMLEELDVEVTGEAANGLEALQLCRERQPEVLLLDIEMPEVDGFDVARHLPEPRPLLIFQTAYDEYALQAFDHAAIDYLVKPVSLDRLERALGRARDRLRSSDQGAQVTPDIIASLRSAISAQPRQPRVLVRDRGGHRLVPFADVYRFTTEEGTVWARLTEARFITDYTLSELEERTAGSFIRVSRGDLVNLDSVSRIVASGDGTGTLELADSTRVRVSRRRFGDVRRALES
jgi:DNA-binding LytR/AlgR family response regulator